MKFHSKSVAVSLAVAALVLAGCTKKPDRPYPGSTVLGPQSTGPAVPTDASFGQNTTGLVDRGADFDPNGHNRTALQGQTVLFDFDKSDVRASEREKLKVAKEYLDKNPTHRLLLEGHCDWRGTAEYNLGLGDRRAAAVRKGTVDAALMWGKTENTFIKDLKQRKSVVKVFDTPIHYFPSVWLNQGNGRFVDGTAEAAAGFVRRHGFDAVLFYGDGTRIRCTRVGRNKSISNCFHHE